MEMIHGTVALGVKNTVTEKVEPVGFLKCCCLFVNVFCNNVFSKMFCEIMSSFLKWYCVL